MEATTLFDLLDQKLLPYYKELQKEDPTKLQSLKICVKSWKKL